MIIDSANGDRLTPTEAAKIILLDAGSTAAYFAERDIVDMERVTEAEQKRIWQALEKQYERMQKFFGHSGWSLG